MVEICERFCFYGVRSILAVYITDELGRSQTEGTKYYHYYISACYITPLLGAFISDQYWGKYKTISILSLVYILGNGVVSYGSYFIDFEGAEQQAFKWTAVGLFLIALGTGGIKPCVSAICGDQFEESQKKERDYFFEIFYICINLGSMISSFLTPKIRALKGDKVVELSSDPNFMPLQPGQVIDSSHYHHGQDHAGHGHDHHGHAHEHQGHLEHSRHQADQVLVTDFAPHNLTQVSNIESNWLQNWCEKADGTEDARCYSVAFGLPSLLMVAALLIFWSGSKLYVKKLPSGSVMVDLTKNAGRRLQSKLFPTIRSKSKWTHVTNDDRYNTKRIFSMLTWILPIAVFWSVFDLAGSRLTYIVKQMDSTIYSPVLRKLLFCQKDNWIKEDQVEAINPLLILPLTFLVRYVWEVIGKCLNRTFTRLTKISCGMFLLVVTCIYIYGLQKGIDEKFTYVFPEYWRS